MVSSAVALVDDLGKRRGDGELIMVAPTGYNPDSGKSKKKEKHAAANYSEAWVEFLDKSVAKTVAKMLNAQVIGGKKGDK